jgi:mono/diheme cytochrome c family protein
LRKALSVILLVLIVLAIAVAWIALRTPSSPFDGAPAVAASPELLQRGEYVARLSDCVACHSTPDSKPFAGGLAMATPLGLIHTTNITPDKDAGIGAYTLADFDRAMRHGVARDGHRLYPAMPYPSYAKLTDDDVKALYVFFMQGVTPDKQQNVASSIPWPLNMRWPLALWNVAFLSNGAYEPKTGDGRTAEWNRGAYLVQGAGHCGSCHTPRSVAFNEKSLDESSSSFVSGALLDGWYAPSLRGEQTVGLGRWSEDELAQFLKTGRNSHAVVFGSMTDVINNSTAYMTDADLKSVAVYLKSLPGNPGHDAPAPAQPNPADATQALASPGGRTFMAKCSFCHGASGEGQAPWIPPLAGSASSMVKEGASSINTTLNGSGRVVAQGIPDSYRMPSFRSQLSDQEIAEVVSYVRTAWGNQGGAVAAKDVKDLRDKTNPSSSNVIVLQMR